MNVASPDLSEYLDALRRAVDAALARALPRDAPAPAAEPMAYALGGGGKRLRPCLTLAAAEAVSHGAGVSPDLARVLALPAACAVEMIHSYSLVHDDLPAMDDDALRRGRPTTHVVFGDGMAVLAGDGLLTEAFAVIADAPSRVVDAGAPSPSAERRVRLVATLAAAAGAAGMVGGQAIDLAAAGRATGSPALALDAERLEDMHARKTGALIRASAALGAIAAGADARTVDVIDAYARDLGLAFQIVDDILDVEGSSAELGKTSGKDAAAGKPTYPSIYGLARSRELAADCVTRATATLESAGLTGRLTELAAWTLNRRK